MLDPALPPPAAAAGRVLVVIPTTGRPELAVAVASVLAQTVPPARVVVVVDPGGAARVSDVRAGLPSHPLLQVLGTTPPHTGGNTARNLGVRSGSEPLVAFLDDDDVWRPDKLEQQLALLGRTPGDRRVVSSRVGLLAAQGARTGAELPRRLPAPSEGIAAYLFRRRQVRYGETLLHTSTLLCDRAVLDRVPWAAGLVRHQDWDWLLSVSQLPDVRLAVSERVLVDVRLSAVALSRTGSWRSSADWVASRSDVLDTRTRADFLLAHTLPLARREPGLRALSDVLVLVARTGRPGLPALGAALLVLLTPRRLRDDRAGTGLSAV